MTWHTNTTGGPHDRPQGPEVLRSRTAADDLEDHIVREAIKSYQRDSGETYVPIDVREGAERAAQVAVRAMEKYFREEERQRNETTVMQRVIDIRSVECERHGGPWGGDETCHACTDAHGEPRIRDMQEEQS